MIVCVVFVERNAAQPETQVMGKLGLQCGRAKMGFCELRESRAKEIQHCDHR